MTYYRFVSTNVCIFHIFYLDPLHWGLLRNQCKATRNIPVERSTPSGAGRDAGNVQQVLGSGIII